MFGSKKNCDKMQEKENIKEKQKQRKSEGK